MYGLLTFLYSICKYMQMVAETSQTLACINSISMIAKPHDRNKP